jgi:plastocyanin
MLFSSVIVAALLSVAQAVDVQVVNVASANNTLRFFPDRVTAPVGSMVQFQFRGGNHTVTQSTFDQPCTPISSVNSSILGIYSGYQPVAASMAMGQIPVFTIMINDTRPIWLYCSQGRHCQNGMSMVINENTAANSTRSLETYKTQASTVQQGNQVPTISGGIGAGGALPSDTPTGQNGLPSGAAGIAAPSTLILAIAAAFLLM